MVRQVQVYNNSGLGANDSDHAVAAKVVSKIERGRPTTLVHGFVLAVFRARARAQ